ncbi:MAG: PKD domain-containing protein [Bacteroidetes bacterium]|nr:MAG: PKD domain-containing protein [Bacteroidota bacterium]
MNYNNQNRLATKKMQRRAPCLNASADGRTRGYLAVKTMVLSTGKVDAKARLSFMPKLWACLILAACLFAQGNTATAAHLKGGYIEYRYIGPTPGRPSHARFSVVVYQYLDCGSQGGQIDADITLGVFNAGTNALDTTYTIPLSGTKITSRTSFECIINPPPVCYRIDSYAWPTVDVPVRVSGTILSVQRCCRIPGIVNITQSSNAGVTYTVKLNANPVGAVYLTNASPVFAQEDTALVCADNRFTFPFKATDPDGDSLVYSFTAGLNTPTATARPIPPNMPPFPDLNYSTGFTADRPLGARVTIDPRTGIIDGVAPSAAGQYVVAVFVEEYRNGISVAVSRKEIHITVGNCDIARADLPKNIINCSDFLVPFQNQSTSSGISSYYWDFGVRNSTSDTSNLPTPTFVYPDTGVYIAKLVVNRGTKCPDSTTTEVRVFPTFDAQFDVVGVCARVAYQFTDRSTTTYGTINNWRWDFGDPSSQGDTSRLRNPAYVYPAAGTYTVTLTNGSNNGCTDTATLSVTVLDKPIIQLAFRDTLICSIDTLQLRAAGTGSFSWRPNQFMIGANTPNPLVFPKDTITYYVDLNDRGCVGVDSVRVNVLDFITVDAGRDTTICRTDTIVLRPITQALSFLWTPSAGLNDNTVKNPRATPLGATTTYTINANLGKCQARDSITIRTVPYPVISAGADTNICFNGTATLVGTSNGRSANWSPANLVSNRNSLITTTTLRSTTAFVLSVTDTLGCPKPAFDTVIVNVSPQVTVFAGRDTSVVLGQPLQLNGVTNGTTFLWTPATGLNSTTIINPVATITPGLLPSGNDTLIVYQLFVSTFQGCNATDALNVRIFKTLPSIFVPSAFTPNGDGRNDVIRPTLAGMRQLNYFRVYNRYGQLVFETRAIGRGWDGRIKGELQATSAFVYDCQAIDYTGKLAKSSGTFTLIR